MKTKNPILAPHLAELLRAQKIEKDNPLWLLLAYVSCLAEMAPADRQAIKEALGDVGAEFRDAANRFAGKAEQLFMTADQLANGTEGQSGLFLVARQTREILADSQSLVAKADKSLGVAETTLRSAASSMIGTKLAVIGIIATIIGQIGWFIYAGHRTNSQISQIIDSSAEITTRLAAIEDVGIRIPEAVQVGKGEDGRTYYYLETQEHKFVWVTLPPQ